MAVLLGPYFLKIRVPDSFGPIIGMADIVASLRPFSADLTYPRHGNFLYAVIYVLRGLILLLS